MGRRRQRVGVSLDSGDVVKLRDEEIRAILRAADELIGVGGRSMLVKILKGSKDKKILEHHLDECPVYGYYRSLTMEEISRRVDWTLEEDYLRIEYSGRLPMLVFSEKGWGIEEKTFAEEIYAEFCRALSEGEQSVITRMKDINRQVVFDVLEMIRNSGKREFIPLLEAWKKVEVRKVRERIESVQKSLGSPAYEPTVSFVKAGKTSAREISELVQKTVRTVYPKYYPQAVADFFAMFHSKDRISQDILEGKVWVLRLDGRIIGTGSLEEEHITRVYVLPEFQGKGYGAWIMGELEKEIRKHHDRAVLDASLPACCFYEKLGYRTVSHQSMSVFDGAVLVYEIMEKRLH